VYLRLLSVSLLIGTVGCSSSSSSSAESSDGSSTTDAPSSIPDSAAGSDGGGTADVQSDRGSASCAGYAYCDDFEGYDGPVTNGQKLGPWVASVMGTTMSVDSLMPYQGNKALHVVVTAGTTAHGVLSQQASGGLVSGNDVFGRAMVYFSNAGDAGPPLGVHSWLFNATGHSGAADGGVTMNLGGGGNPTKMQINYHPPAPLTEKSVQGGTMMSTGAWHCVQWEYDGSGTSPADDAKLWVDGTLAVEAKPSEGWNFATPWSAFDFGFTHYQTLADGVDVFLDDFALNGTMIPCP
jgi:hypothetical protein